MVIQQTQTNTHTPTHGSTMKADENANNNKVRKMRIFMEMKLTKVIVKTDAIHIKLDLIKYRPFCGV